MRSNPLFLSVLGALGACALLASAASGCGSDADGDAADPSSSGTGAGSSGGDCTPPAACTDVVSECIAQEDNTGNDKPGLRMSYLTITSPEALASLFVQQLVLDGVLLDKPACYLDGQGTFSWLLEFDKAAGTLKTGGAAPSTPEQGYCFLQGDLGGLNVSPIVVDAALDNGQFSVTTGKDVVVPIFDDTTGDSYILLPLRQARIYDATLSADGNCIGKHNSDGLTTIDQCLSSVPDYPAFVAGASLDGFITLEDADTVIVPQLGATLCTIIAKNENDGGTPKKCVRDGEGKVTYVGDWCSETNTAGGCKDAVRLGATFSASAAKITGDCPQ
ncbi:MAG: hypothetical protein WKG00_03925 [Polyangiaceae bacterium]